MHATTKPLSMAQRILRVLAESPLPVSTPDLMLMCAAGLNHPRARVWVELSKLHKAGLVVKTWGRSREARDGCEGQAVAYWRLAT